MSSANRKLIKTREGGYELEAPADFWRRIFTTENPNLESTKYEEAPAKADSVVKKASAATASQQDVQQITTADSNKPSTPDSASLWLRVLQPTRSYRQRLIPGEKRRLFYVHRRQRLPKRRVELAKASLLPARPAMASVPAVVIREGVSQVSFVGRMKRRLPDEIDGTRGGEDSILPGMKRSVDRAMGVLEGDREVQGSRGSAELRDRATLDDTSSSISGFVAQPLGRRGSGGAEERTWDEELGMWHRKTKGGDYVWTAKEIRDDLLLMRERADVEMVMEGEEVDEFW